MALGDGSLQNEWAPGRMGTQNGDLELEKFEPRHSNTLYTHINHIMQKNQFQQKEIARGLPSQQLRSCQDGQLT